MSARLFGTRKSKKRAIVTDPCVSPYLYTAEPILRKRLLAAYDRAGSLLESRAQTVEPRKRAEEPR